MEKKTLLLIIILLLALALRVYKLDNVPIELFGDEIDVGLQAHSILKTGSDYFGNRLPLMFQSFTEQRLPLFIYSDVLFIAIFGLNEWGVRLASVFWGVLGIFGIFLFSQKLFKENSSSKNIGLISALILAITPWHIQYSRQAGIESGMLLTVILFACWAFLKGLDNFKWLIISAILFALSFYVYATSALFVTLLALTLLTIFRKTFFKLGLNKIITLTVLISVLLMPFLFLTFQGKSTERSGKISIFTERELNDDLFSRRKYESNSITSKIWHNKFLTYSEAILGNYFNAFSSNFLFFRGDPNLRHSSDRGMLFLFQLFLITIGIIASVRKKLNYKFLLALIILSPIPSSLTIDGGFHGSRLIFMLIPLTIFSALGVLFLIENYKLKHIKFISFIILLFVFLNILVYFHRYYNDYARDSWRFWQSGYKEALLYIKEIDPSYSRVYFNNTYEPSIPRFLFWYGYNISEFQKEFSTNSFKKDITLGFDGYKLGKKYYFGSLSKQDKYAALGELLKPNELYMVSSRDEAGQSDWRIDPPGDILVLKTVVNPFDKPIFYIVTKR